MRALVTGAAGFIGSTLVDRLLAHGALVVGVDNLSSGSVDNLEQAYAHSMSGAQQFSFIRLDVQAPELADVVDGCNPDVVFHLAAQVDPLASVRDPQFDARNNIVGTINVCEATRRAGVRRVVYAGSGEAAWSAGPGSICEGPTVVKLTPHNAAKAAGDLYLRAYASAYALDPVTLMLGTVYGPRQSTSGGPGVINALCGGVPSADLIAECEHTFQGWDFVYVDDVVDAFMWAAGLPPGHAGTYPVSSGVHTSLEEVRNLVAEGMRTLVATASGRHSLPARSPASIPDRHAGWEPTVDLETGMLRTLCWLGAGVDMPALESA